MKNAWLVSVLLVMVVGCGSAAREIKMKSQVEKTGVFTEISDAEAPPQGFANLLLKATIKTHLENYYILESKEAIHGKQGYPFLINIDGQAETWKVEGKQDSLPLYDKEGKTSHDPEAGEGIKYALEKKIRLRAGAHKVFLGLSADDYFKEVEISLKEGSDNILEFKPIYKYKLPGRIPAFKKGPKEFEAYLNGTRIL
jgi:hypothetical protein